MTISQELEGEITVVKTLLLHLLIGADKLREIERLTYIGELLSYVLDDDDFEGDAESCIAYEITEKLSSMLIIDDDCQSFISEIKQVLLDREKYEFLHYLEL